MKNLSRGNVLLLCALTSHDARGRSGDRAQLRDVGGAATVAVRAAPCAAASSALGLAAVNALGDATARGRR